MVSNRSPRDRVAIIGGGAFGVTAAIELGKQGYKVDLFEQKSELLAGTSGHNNLRLHRGYHYPRSPRTVQQVLQSVDEFASLYHDAIVSDIPHYVGISASDSKTSPEQYIDFCESYNLPYQIISPDFFNDRQVGLAVRVFESAVDLVVWRSTCSRLLARSNVRVFLSSKPSASQLKDYRTVVLATHWSMNQLGPRLGAQPRVLSFDVVELAMVKAQAKASRASILVLDGPFMCIDPMGRSGRSIIGHVNHGLHAHSQGLYPVIPHALRSMIEQGLVRRPPCSDWPKMEADGRRIFSDFSTAEYLGSFFAIRAMSPSNEWAGERESSVEQIGENLYSILGGKLTSAPGAAHNLVSLLNHG